MRRWQKHYDDALGGQYLKPALRKARFSKLKTPPKLTAKIYEARPYTWKCYVLGDVYMLCQHPLLLSLALGHQQDLRQSMGGWVQPREKRNIEPVEFWPHELAPGYKPGAAFRCSPTEREGQSHSGNVVCGGEAILEPPPIRPPKRENALPRKPSLSVKSRPP